MSSFKTFRDTDDPNAIVIVMEVMDKLGAIMNDPKNQAVKDRHTVKEPIVLSMPVPVPVQQR